MKISWRSGPLAVRSFRLLAGVLIAVAMVFGLTQREFRTFGALGDAVPQATANAAAYTQAAEDSKAADDSKAAEGSRK